MSGGAYKFIYTTADSVLCLYRRMYWVAGDDALYAARLDGSERRMFLRVSHSYFDGTVLDVRRDRLLTHLLTSFSFTVAL